jgi:hypothetical protein
VSSVGLALDGFESTYVILQHLRGSENLKIV